MKRFLWVLGFLVVTYRGIESVGKMNLEERGKKDGGKR